MTALSGLLASIRVRASRFALSSLPSPWAIAFAPRQAVMMHIVTTGSAQLATEHERHRIVPGDLVVLARGGGHTLSDGEGRRPKLVDFDMHPSVARGAPAVFPGQGPRTVLMCAELTLGGLDAHPVLRGMPDMVVAHVAPAQIASLLALVTEELGAGVDGGDVIAARHTEAMFLYAARQWLVSTPLGKAFAEPSIARALVAMQEAPASPWTLVALARRAGLSRTIFAERFASAVGEPPLAHLARWRMHFAAALLAEHPEQSVARVAQEVGYASEAAFSRAFKRVTGMNPSALRRRTPEQEKRTPGDGAGRQGAHPSFA